MIFCEIKLILLKKTSYITEIVILPQYKRYVLILNPTSSETIHLTLKFMNDTGNVISIIMYFFYKTRSYQTSFISSDPEM